jgi:multimeric flavodoxin WrbA
MEICLINFYPKLNSKNNSHHSIEYILKPFKTSLLKNNNEVHIIDVESLNIQPCLGCSHDPFFEPKDFCQQIDDMNELYPKLRNSELWVFNISVNSHIIPNQLVNFLDRLEPLFDKEIDILDEINFPDNSKKKGSVFLISTSEYFDKSIFNHIIQEIQTIAFVFNRNYLGQFVRPHLESFVQLNLLKNENNFGNNISKISELILQHNPVRNGILSEIELDVINKEDYNKQFSSIVSNF